MIRDREERAFPGQAHQPVFQRAPVVLAEHGQEDGVAQPALGRIPVDVEVGRIRARRSVLEHVPPPRVTAPRDGHVVGHDVEDLPEPVSREREAQTGVTVGAAQLFVHPRVVDDVVAVRASGHGLQVRGAIEVCDTEVGQIAGDVRRVVEGESALELDAVRRVRRISPRRSVDLGIERHRAVRTQEQCPRSHHAEAEAIEKSGLVAVALWHSSTAPSQAKGLVDSWSDLPSGSVTGTCVADLSP